MWGVVAKAGKTGQRSKWFVCHIMKAYETLFPMSFVSYQKDKFGSHVMGIYTLHLYRYLKIN